MKKKYVKICPKCGNTKIQNDYSIAAEWAYGAPISLVCKNCGYVSDFFPEVEVSKVKTFKEKIKSSPKKFNKVNVRYGKGYLYGIGKILGPFLILTSLVVFLMFLDSLLFWFDFEFDTFFTFLWTLAIGIFLTYYAYSKKHRKKP